MANLTISEIIKQAAINVGKDEPSSITASTDKDIKQMLQFSLEEGRKLRDQYIIPQLKKSYEFDTVDGTSQYVLPGDFWRMISDTQWDQDESWKMIGPMTDQEWSTLQHGVISALGSKQFRVFGNNTDSGQFYVSPTPGEANTLSFDYIRKQWIFPVAWVASTSYTSGDYVSANGNIYTAGSTDTSGATRPSGTTTSDDGTITWTYVADQLYGDTTERWQADTDFPLIDSDLMIKAVVWRYLHRKGLDYEQDKIEYDKECAKRFSRLGGAPKLSLAGGGIITENIPDGNFG